MSRRTDALKQKWEDQLQSDRISAHHVDEVYALCAELENELDEIRSRNSLYQDERVFAVLHEKKYAVLAYDICIDDLRWKWWGRFIADAPAEKDVYDDNGKPQAPYVEEFGKVCVPFKWLQDQGLIKHG
ncbi:hypothetical protein ACFSHT_22400 [Paraburkholderia silviterrae]|uniref:Uncharacterized protein n=1 Tax=Paraburkholderia silviterrae TaxID=2528715 RepID=A0A4R5MF46_9BURK|nr:hypothetical protein [Paraburkholderia silviterrae]TDG25868.1 hypothetical protein EYW47_00410 [Paraburkholderia silviterrae]